MTATSQFRSLTPANGRLHDDRGGGWCALEAKNGDDWLQVDLGKTFQVCGVATQGNRDENENEWVTDFTLSHSSDGNNWTPCLTKSNEKAVSLDLNVIRLNSVFVASKKSYL